MEPANQSTTNDAAVGGVVTGEPAAASPPTPVTATGPALNTQPTNPDFAYESNPFKVSITGLLTMLKVNPMTSILVGLWLILLIIGAYFIGGVLTALSPIIGIIVMLILIFVVLGISIGMYAALAVNSMNGTARRTKELSQEATKKLISVIGASILLALIISLGFILLIVPGFIFAAWFSFTFLVMFDENVGAIEAMKRSKALAKGHVIEVLAAVFAGSLLSGSGFGSGGLLSPALGMAPTLGRYEQLKTLKASNAPKPAVHWLNYFTVFGLTIIFGIIVAAYIALTVVAMQNNAKKTELQNNNLNSLQQQLNNSQRYNTNYNNNYSSPSSNYDYSTPSYSN